ncbi:FadR family transcriptional regulator [Halosquirtibacter xylanolyticus]|uniref:FadR/GntR family transcriptional regulator n=1 Tax=Halosquirtibacter xylanolyticus TaxID=3374599 RepID=UPI00374A066A|nr:FadR family transcriptional regulator [Prolixibacteraceae bacterium]
MKNIFSDLDGGLTLVQRVIKTLETAILQRKIQEGTRLPAERELCELLSVSRTTVREALRSLSAKGLVEIRKGSGVYVSHYAMNNALDSVNHFYNSTFNEKWLHQLAQFRLQFEPQVARMAAKSRNGYNLECIKKNIERSRLFTEYTDRKTAALDVEFHQLIAQATHNRFVVVSMEPVFNLLPKLCDSIYAEDGYSAKEVICDRHQIVYDAIKDQDEDRAEEAMRNHIGEFIDHYSQYVEENQSSIF